MYIAICDDELQDLHTLENAIKQYDTSNLIQISSFTSAKDLLTSSGSVLYDIAVLDIEMSSPNGYDVAVELLKKSKPPLIIFATNSMEYTIRGYGVAFRYITKPITYEKISAVLDAAIPEVRANRFVFSVDGASQILHMQDIYYVEVYNHVTTLHTMDGEYSIRATLKDVQAQLPQGYFGMPHQSYIVNFQHIKTATAQEVSLTNGAKLPVSRRRQTDFNHKLHAYLGR